MDTRLLNGIWRCTLPNGLVKEVSVPGCVEQVWDEWAVAGPFVYETNFEYHGNGQAMLRFGGVSYHCDVYLNDKLIGAHEGMWDSFALPCGEAIRQGSNTLRLVITKPGYTDRDAYPLRAVLSGFIPDVLTTFGGIWDDVCLLEANSLFVLDHFAEGDCNGAGKAVAQVHTSQAGMLRCRLTISNDRQELCTQSRMIDVAQGPQTISLDFQVTQPRLWEPDDPTLYRYRLCFELNGCVHEAQGRFGFREVAAKGRHLLLNRKPVYLRGILHWGYYDNAIIPNPGEDTIRNELASMKAHGFNAVKHCLYIPRRRYFELMDEMGMLAWVELPLWLPDMSTQLEERIRREYPRMLRSLRGYPCLSLLSLGCELDKAIQADLLKEMYQLAKDESGVPIRDNSGSGECYGGLAEDFADFYDYHFYAELPHLEQLIEHFTPAWREEKPWIFGEFCDSDTMRDLQEIRKGKGRQALRWEPDDKLKNPISLLKPDFYLGSHDARMTENGIRQEYALIKSLSYNHSLTHRKTTLELTRAFPEICGYNVTSIRDVPIATSGMMDDLGQIKFDPAVFRRFNSDAVLLQAWDLSRVWQGADRVLPTERYNFTGNSMYAVRILLSNYTGRNLSGCNLIYRLSQDETAWAEGCLPVHRLMPHASVTEAAYLNIRLPAVAKPAALMLEVWLKEGPREVAHNDFPVFVYPETKPAEPLFVWDPAGMLWGLTMHLEAAAVQEGGLGSLGEDAVLISSAWTDTIRRYVEGGGKLLLITPGGGSLPVIQGPMWREGMIRHIDHPILEDIAAQGRYDSLRYYSMTADASIDSRALAAWGVTDITPVIRRYDCRKWTASEYLCTFRLGRGVCAATTLRLGNGLGKTPPFAHQNPFAGYLLSRITDYLRCT